MLISFSWAARRVATVAVCFAFLIPGAALHAQAPSAVGGIHPNTAARIERPLRYRPVGEGFVIRNGAERFNRPLYGGNTAFRVDGGDKPEFVLYLPGRGGNLRFALRTRGEVRWLHEAANIDTGYRPGELFYAIRDPMLGEQGVLRLTAIAYANTEGLILQIRPERISRGVELLWAFGGVNGQRGKRDGDIGTEAVPISEWFQPKPEFAADNQIESQRDGRFVLTAKAATLVGLTWPALPMRAANADHWDRPADLFAPLTNASESPPDKPLVVGAVPLDKGNTYLSLQRIGTDKSENRELDVYSAVTAKREDAREQASGPKLAAEFPPESLATQFDNARAHFTSVRRRVTIDTPDPFLNAAVGALNVAADAVWD